MPSIVLVVVARSKALGRLVGSKYRPPATFLDWQSQSARLPWTQNHAFLDSAGLFPPTLMEVASHIPWRDSSAFLVCARDGFASLASTFCTGSDWAGAFRATIPRPQQVKKARARAATPVLSFLTSIIFSTPSMRTAT